jgi:molecular chaperone DnaJ
MANYNHPMSVVDHYVVLGLPPAASQDEVRRAYRDMARKLHPDVNKAADATQRFTVVQRAYEILADPRQRAEYDSLRAYHSSGGGGASESVGAAQAHYTWSNIADPATSVAHSVDDFDDIYETFFAHRKKNNTGK